MLKKFLKIFQNIFCKPQAEEITCHQHKDCVRIIRNGKLEYEGPIEFMPIDIRQKFRAFYRDQEDFAKHKTDQNLADF
jgi:hypothetical protein